MCKLRSLSSLMPLLTATSQRVVGLENLMVLTHHAVTLISHYFRMSRLVAYGVLLASLAGHLRSEVCLAVCAPSFDRSLAISMPMLSQSP